MAATTKNPKLKGSTPAPYGNGIELWGEVTDFTILRSQL
jgi:hypothetical protein